MAEVSETAAPVTVTSWNYDEFDSLSPEEQDSKQVTRAVLDVLQSTRIMRNVALYSLPCNISAVWLNTAVYYRRYGLIHLERCVSVGNVLFTYICGDECHMIENCTRCRS